MKEHTETEADTSANGREIDDEKSQDNNTTTDDGSEEHKTKE